MSALLEVVIGILLIFLVFSIVVSGVQEWWAQITAKRGKYLHLGLSRLLNDNAIFVRVLQHPLVGGMYRERGNQGKPPSYLEPNNFALALASVVLHRGKTTPVKLGAPDMPNVQSAPGTVDSSTLTFAALRAALVECGAQDSPVAAAVLPIVDNARGDLDEALKGIEAWFNAGMDRVAGWYKANSQKSLFVIAFFLALIANVDSVEIFHALNSSPQLRSSLAQTADQMVQSGSIANIELAELKTRAPTETELRSVGTWINSLQSAGQSARLPIGYTCLTAMGQPSNSVDGQRGVTAPLSLTTTWRQCKSDAIANWSQTSVSGLLLKLVGFVIAALACVIGAPYWFDLLVKIVNIRGSGNKPRLPSK